MAVAAGPDIVDDGLVFCVDAGNVKSYPGTGTILYDLGPNKMDFNLIGSISWNQQGKYFTNFIDNSSYFDIRDPSKISLLPTGSANRTIISVCRPPTNPHPAYSHVIHYGTANTNQAFGISTSSSGALRTHPWSGSPSAGTATLGQDVFTAVAYRQSDSNHLFWINGVSQGSGGIRAINTGTSQFRIGSRISTPIETWQSTGRIMNVLIYNRVLSDVEIAKTYYTMRLTYNI